MARSQQSFSKREKEKKRLKKREEKQKKKEARKAEAKESNGGIPFAYLDKYGNLTDTPQDLSDKEETDIESIELSVPKKEDHQDTIHYPGLIRAADLIGQLSDPRYLKKISALFYEFEETGQNKELEYKTPHDLRSNYPKFYWGVVHHYIHDSLRYLALTQEGKQIIANLYSNVFMVEYERDLLPC